jgi:hypothetical protein
MLATVSYSQANRREVLSTGRSSTGVLARSLSIWEQYGASDGSFRRQCNARNGLYSIGIPAQSLIGSGGSTVPAVVRVAFELSLGRRDIGAELVGSWQYGVSGGVSNAGISAQLIGWKVKAVLLFLAWC